MASGNIDESWQPKLKGDRGKNRDRDKFRNNYDNIFGRKDDARERDREEGVPVREEPGGSEL